MCVILYIVTGQYPKFIKSRKQAVIGCRVTLRNANLYVFLEKLNTFIFPYIQLPKLMVPRVVDSRTFLLCFKTLNLFFESDFIYSNFTKYLTRFNTQAQCFIYFKYTRDFDLAESRNFLTLSQVCMAA